MPVEALFESFPTNLNLHTLIITPASEQQETLS
jgi:hypothetical protein